MRIMGTAEIAALLGVTPARVSQIVDSVKQGFPRPRWRIKAGQVWLAQDVEAWAARRRRPIAEDPES